MSQTFGQKILELRRAKGLTQRELAEKMKRDFAYISKIENDKLDSPPSEGFIRELAHALGADSEVLISYANSFDRHALRKVANKMPEAGLLFRRLQRGEITREQLQEFLESINKKKND